MKVRENIKPLVIGMAVGLIPAVIMATTSFTGTSKIDDNPKFLLQPIAEHYEPKWDLSFMNYEGGVVNSKTKRYYERGKDWIIIKDFPLIIDDYQAHYKDISDQLWSK
tara:strand:+ start:14356 stop:14679 length:324 start_codon:yes stop_codon:yes gene_type:complete